MFKGPVQFTVSFVPIEAAHFLKISIKKPQDAPERKHETSFLLLLRTNPTRNWYKKKPTHAVILLVELSTTQSNASTLQCCPFTFCSQALPGA